MIFTVDVCVPLYNEELNIELLIENFIKSKSNSSNIGNLILIDNGSTDGTWKMICKFKHESVQLLRIKQNIGYGGGAALAIEQSQSKYVALIPANNQYPFTEITKMIDLFCSMKLSSSKPLLIKGKRVGRKDPIGTRILSYSYTILMSAAVGKYFSDINGLPKIFERDAIVAKFHRFPRNASFDAALLLEARRHGFEFREIPIPYLPRLHGQPSWKNKRIKISIQMLKSIIRYRFKR